MLHDLTKVRLPGSRRVQLVAYVFRHAAPLRTDLAGFVRANSGLCADSAATDAMVTELSIMAGKSSSGSPPMNATLPQFVPKTRVRWESDAPVDGSACLPYSYTVRRPPFVEPGCLS